MNAPCITPIRDIIFIIIWERSANEPQVFFQPDQQIDISLYPTEATTFRHSRELASLKPSWCDFSPTSFLTTRILKSIPFHFNA